MAQEGQDIDLDSVIDRLLEGESPSLTPSINLNRIPFHSPPPLSTSANSTSFIQSPQQTLQLYETVSKMMYGSSNAIPRRPIHSSANFHIQPKFDIPTKLSRSLANRNHSEM